MKGQPTYEELLVANRELQNELKSLKSYTEKENRAGFSVKSRFLSSFSHEIRTPMTAILGFSDLLKENDLSETDRRIYINYICQNSYALLNVMDTIIDLSLLEEKEVKLNEERVFIEDLLYEIYENYNSRIVRTMEKKVVLLLTTPPELDRALIRIDGLRLYRIIDNLVCNTIMQQSGGVIELRMEAPADGWYRISVISEQNEMLAERAKMIFENNEYQDDWQDFLDLTGMAYKFAKGLSKLMGGDAELVLDKCGKMQVSVVLPIEGSSGKKQVQTDKKASKLLN